ncbi:FHA domain-containing protein, partial [Pyxidicoccus sp. 3LG]
MPASHDGDLETFDLPASSGPPTERFHLLVVKEGSSSVFTLPHVGVVTIGRAPEADLSIDDGSISRQHARLVISEEQPRVSDLGSRNGTFVNGQPVEGTRPLIAGDVIGVGTVTLVLQGGARTRPEHTPVSVEQLRRRLAEELERALHYERPTAVLALDCDTPPARPEETVAALRAVLRLHDVLAWSTPGQLLVLLPELGEEEARLVGAELLA